MARRKESRRHPDEIRFDKRHPSDGQQIAFRAYCHRRYWLGEYNATTQSVRVGSYTYGSGMLGGWVPADRVKDGKFL